MPARVFPWMVRVMWLLLPFTTGAAMGSALRPEPDPLRFILAALAWAVWAAVLVATLVPHPVGLTALRCVAPGVAVTAAVCAASGRASVGVAAAGLVAAAAATLVAMLASTGVWFVNGPAYPNERRFPLAIPGALLLGPLELAWLLVVGAPVGAVVLLATGHWVAGPPAAVAAGACVWVLGRALHSLSRRWVVFVPAGLVLHDPASLLDPVLFRRQVVESLGPAPAGSDSLDLTERAMGLALELRLIEKVPMTRVTPGRRRGEPGASARLLFTPTRPGAVLKEAASRRFPMTAAGAARGGSAGGPIRPPADPPPTADQAAIPPPSTSAPS